MAVSDEIFIIGMLIIFIYLFVYKNNKILGGMLLLATSIGISYYLTTNIGDLAGLLMMLGSIAILVWDILNIKIPKGGTKGGLLKVLK